LTELLDHLGGGDLHSIGRSNEVVMYVGQDEAKFDELIHGMFHNNPLIRMRSADAAEKVSRQFPNLLHKHRNLILGSLSSLKQQEVKWHIASMLFYLDPLRRRSRSCLFYTIGVDQQV